jgi:starvation-inducible DNA-binding protein
MAPNAVLEELASDTRAVVGSMLQMYKLCDEFDDVATASLLEGYVDAAEKRAWFVRETSVSR